jgi:hypothetical protein
MRVQMNDGSVYIVLLGVDHGFDNTKDIMVCPGVETRLWSALDTYDEDLVQTNGKRKVVKVSIPNHTYDIFYYSAGWKTIWERPKIKMTLKEIEKKLGYEITLVESNN